MQNGMTVQEMLLEGIMKTYRIFVNQGIILENPLIKK